MKAKHLTTAIVTLFCSTAVLLFCSCSKDKKELILGEWHRAAMYWTYSGSPNPEQNYSSGGPMYELAGASDLRVIFFEDNTGMFIEYWFIDPEDYGIDTISFTYSIDGDEGVIKKNVSKESISWETSISIQDIKPDFMTIYEKTVAKNYHDYEGDTSHYTRVMEHNHHFTKIK